MEQSKEREIFDTATEKLDVYVPSLLKYHKTDMAREFLQPGGQYVRFAVKQFIKELMGELIKPVGEFKEEPQFMNMDPIFDTVSKELPAHYQVKREMIGYIYSEFINVTISDILSFRLKRWCSYHFNLAAVCVYGYEEDDDSDWMGLVADELEDEALALEASGETDEASAIFFPDQTVEFCRAAEYVYANYERYREMAEDKARRLREEFGLA